MNFRVMSVAVITTTICMAARANEPIQLVDSAQLISKPSYPVVSDGGYALLEIWPTVKDITLSAFFLDNLDEKSRNLCESLKKSLDRDAEARAREQDATFTSYRLCMTIKDAVRLGWIEAKVD